MSKKCIECGSPTHPIRVLDEGGQEGHLMPEYAAIDSKRSWFFGRYPVEGHLAAELCESCGRVTFRAVPDK
jgi:uncharacterized OB-fold protein